MITAFAGSSAALQMVARSSCSAKTIRRPSAVNSNQPAQAAGVVTPWADRERGPTPRQSGSATRFIVPPRLLASYMYLPSGDQTGLQSTAVSSVTWTGVELSDPSLATVRMSRCAARVRPPYTIRRPEGDHRPPTASASATLRRAPSERLTIHSVLWVCRLIGSMTGSPATTRALPSGDQRGSYPASVMRRTYSPVASITKMPPPARSERNAIRAPSGKRRAPCRAHRSPRSEARRCDRRPATGRGRRCRARR